MSAQSGGGLDEDSLGSCFRREQKICQDHSNQHNTTKTEDVPASFLSTPAVKMFKKTPTWQPGNLATGSNMLDASFCNLSCSLSHLLAENTLKLIYVFLFPRSGHSCLRERLEILRGGGSGNWLFCRRRNTILPR